MRRLFVGVLAILALTPLAGGTILIKKRLSELAREAEAIVLARVADSRCAWNADQTLIWTTTLLDVLETWKGQPGDRIAVMEPGGEVPPVGQHVPSMARYTPGERVLVFLKKDALGQWRTHGCVQGAFRVVPDAGRVPRIDLTSWHQHVMEGITGAQGAGPPLTVDELRGIVSRLLEAKGGEGR